MADSYETRTVTAEVEFREDAGSPVVIGHAATFNQPYQVGFFTEQIHRDAFKRTLSSSPDVRLLVDHEGQPLARTKSGTLSLGTDETGLTVRAELDPSDPDVQRLVPKMRRGDMDQMSFAFRVPQGGDIWDHTGETPLRTIREASLSGGDVSIVTYPANENASVALRKREAREANYTLAMAFLKELHEGRDVSFDRLGPVFAAIGLDLDRVGYQDRTNRILSSLARDVGHEVAKGLTGKQTGLTPHEAREIDKALLLDKRAQMSTADINDLPDSDFAYIEPGGEKDSEGKTTPRSLRHFPIHDAAHVRNALARAPQSPFGEKAIPKILAAAKRLGVDVNQNSAFGDALVRVMNQTGLTEEQQLAILDALKRGNPRNFGTPAALAQRLSQAAELKRRAPRR